MKYQIDTELAWVRTVIQMEAASGTGRSLPALREAEAILESEAQPSPILAGRETCAGSKITHAAVIADSGLTTEKAPSAAANPSEAPIPPTEKGPETHRVIVDRIQEPGGVLRPVYGEHPAGGCANCRARAGGRA